MPLSDTTIRNAKPGAKPVRLYDSGGLYLEISPLAASCGASSTASVARRSV